jgi:hypothetical protein
VFIDWKKSTAAERLSAFEDVGYGRVAGKLCSLKTGG